MRWYFYKKISLGSASMDALADSMKTNADIQNARNLNAYGNEIVNNGWKGEDKTDPNLPIYLLGGLLFLGVCFTMMKKM